MRDAKAEFEKIQNLISKGSYDEVKPLLKAYLAENQDNALAYKLYGNVFAFTGYLAKARLIWRGALKKFPENTDLLYNLALSGFLQGKPSRIYLKKLLEINPEDTGAISMLGQLAKDEGRYYAAIKHWKKAIRLEEDNVEAMNNIGVSYAIMGSFGKAAVWYRKALEIDEYYALVHFNLASALYETGEYEEAEKHADKAIELDPGTHMEQGTQLLKQIEKKIKK